MTKPATIKKTETSKEEKVRAAKQAFYLGLIDLSWKLALAFLLPVIIGVALNQTIWGVIIGLFMSFLVIVRIARTTGVED